MKWPFDWYFCALKKPNKAEAKGRWVEVWGWQSVWGIPSPFPGWIGAYYHDGYIGDGKGGLVFEKRRKGWWHHSSSQVSPALIWKYVPNPNIRKED